MSLNNHQQICQPKDVIPIKASVFPVNSNGSERFKEKSKLERKRIKNFCIFHTNKYLEWSNERVQNCKGINGLPFTIPTSINQTTFLNNCSQLRYKFRPQILLHKLNTNNNAKLETNQIKIHRECY